MTSASIEQVLITAVALISHLRDTLANVPLPEPLPSTKAINPLALSSTAAALIKAQITKLTLLALNKPFTPSSIIQILNTVSTSPLPALITAVQQCDAVKFGKFARNELQSKVSRLLGVYKNLLDEIPTTAEAQQSKIAASRTKSSGNHRSTDQRAALRGTGLVWEICDEIVSFSEQGLGIMASKKMTSYRELYNDATEEIAKWLHADQSSDHVEEHLNDLSLGDTDSDSTFIVSFSSHPTKETIPIAEWALDVLHLIALLYLPLIKRRIQRFPECNKKTALVTVPTKDIPKLDLVLDAGKSWSEQIDLIAEALFENDAESAIIQVDRLIESTEESVKVTKAAWDGSEDKFSAWIDQWKKRMSEVKIKRTPPP